MQYKREFLVPSQLHPIPQVLYQSFWSWWFCRKSRRTYSHFSVQPARKPPPLGLIMPFASYQLLIPTILPKFSARLKLNDSTWMKLFVPQSVLKSVWADLTKLTSFMPRYVWFDCAAVSFSQKASEDDNYYDKPSLLLASDPPRMVKSILMLPITATINQPKFSLCVSVIRLNHRPTLLHNMRIMLTTVRTQKHKQTKITEIHKYKKCTIFAECALST